MNGLSFTLTIVIPAYNEGQAIGAVVSKVRGICPDAEVLVVDDASGDDTAAVAADHGARVIRHPYNKGNGAAVKTGIRNATGEVVLLMDADGQHDADDIRRLLSYIPDYDLVVGARSGDSDTAVQRDLGNWVLNRLASYMVGREIPDLTSGFRAMKREMIMEFIHLLPNGFSYPTTSTLAFIKAGYSVKFVPIKAHKRIGKSKIKLARDGTKFTMIIFKIITLYSPLRIFFPISLLSFLLGAGYAAYTIWTEVHITNSSALLISMSIIIFLMGLVSEQIAAMRFERKE
ncbi:MAG: glycosyltransferase [Chloroflexi bacterium]|nr:glycosyltransferase [Chloroflexota bacterium]